MEGFDSRLSRIKYKFTWLFIAFAGYLLTKGGLYGVGCLSVNKC